MYVLQNLHLMAYRSIYYKYISYIRMNITGDAAPTAV